MPKDLVFKGKGGDFHYIDWGGSGPLVHIAHATGFCARVYQPLAALMTSRVRAVGLDDRGHGLTRAEADVGELTSWRDYASDLEAFFEHLGEPVIALGHSRGGVASLMLAVSRPDLVKALILIDPTILPLSWAWWSWPIQKLGLAHRVPIAAKAARRKNGWPTKEAVLASYRQKGPFAAWKPGFLEGYVADGTRTKPDGTIELSCAPAWESRSFATFCPNAWGYVRRLKQPALVLYGEDSDTFLPAAVKRFKKNGPRGCFQGI